MTNEPTRTGDTEATAETETDPQGETTATETHENDTDAPEATEGDTAAQKARREAKALRERLRASEQDRDALAARVTAAEDAVTAANERVELAHRRRIEQVAVDAGLIDPGLFWVHARNWTGRLPATVDDFCDETGALDPGKVLVEVRRIRDNNPKTIRLDSPIGWETRTPITMARKWREKWPKYPPLDAPPEVWEQFEDDQRASDSERRKARLAALDQDGPTLGSVISDALRR